VPEFLLEIGCEELPAPWLGRPLAVSVQRPGAATICALTVALHRASEPPMQKPTAPIRGPPPRSTRASAAPAMSRATTGIANPINRRRASSGSVVATP